MLQVHIDGLQRRYHMTLLASLFATSRNLVFGVFLPIKHITILQKVTINFRQVSLKGVLLSVRVLSRNISVKSFNSTCKKVKSLKKFSYIWTSSQVAFEVSINIFLTYSQKPVCFIYGRHICFCIHICKKSISSRLCYSWDGKWKKNKS